MALLPPTPLKYAPHIPPCLNKKVDRCHSYFSYCCDKTPHRSNLKGNGSRFKDTACRGWESWWQEHEAAGQVACAVSKQSAVSAAAPFLISLLVRPPAQGWPTVRVGLPTSISLVNIIPHRQAIGYSRSPPQLKATCLSGRDIGNWALPLRLYCVSSTLRNEG